MKRTRATSGPALANESVWSGSVTKASPLVASNVAARPCAASQVVTVIRPGQHIRHLFQRAVQMDRVRLRARRDAPLDEGEMPEAGQREGQDFDAVRREEGVPRVRAMCADAHGMVRTILPNCSPASSRANAAPTSASG